MENFSEMVKNLKGLSKGNAALFSQKAEVSPPGVTATKRWLETMADQWEKLGEAITEENARSVDRVFLAGLANATQEALGELEMRIVAIETQLDG